jgi:hypothetical protein
MRETKMDEVDRTIRYLFILGLVLILVAYWAGSQKVLQTVFTGANQLDLTATGRTASGTFAGYPTGG